MSTIVATHPVMSLPTLDRRPSPRNYPALASSSHPSSIDRNGDTVMTSDKPPSLERTPTDPKRSPHSMRGSGHNRIAIKKEPPSSPSLQSNGRHRPKKLDLSAASPSAPNGLGSATPGTARDGLVLQDVGLACLSPGFQTDNPAMREQLQRSMSVREQQRSIIEARLLKSAKGDAPEMPKAPEQLGMGKPPMTANKKRPPPGLSIVAPSAQAFANERVIQSAPLNQTFTGRNPSHIGSRPQQPSNLSQASHIHHVPAVQTSNRLPPISDVFGSETLNPPPSSRPAFLHANSTPSNPHGPPLPSPGFPPQTAHPMSQPPPQTFERPREYRSAEEAVHEMTGGREELQPRLVHYNSHQQPPTPPSPQTRHHDNDTPMKFSVPSYGPNQPSKRRSRNEYEADSSPPLGSGRERMRYGGPFGEGRDSPATQRAKKEEFLSLCSRAWDLFHS